MHRPLYLFLGPIVAQLVLLQACKNGHGLTGSLSPGTISTASTASPIASVGDRRPDNAPVPDAKLASAIEGAMGRDPVLGPSSIHVSVTHGEVTLAGNVPTLAARWRAGRLVEAFKGATSLSNGIRVQASPQPDAETAKAVKDAIGRDPALRSAKVRSCSEARWTRMRSASS